MSDEKYQEVKAPAVPVGNNQAAAIALTPKDLQDLIAVAVSEAVRAAKAPNEIEQRQLDIEKKRILEENNTRLETSQIIKDKMAQDALHKRTCAHEGGKPTHPHVVFVSDDPGGFILCQVCHAVVRPENQLTFFPKNFAAQRSDVIFDSTLFNRLFQMCDAGGGLFA